MQVVKQTKFGEVESVRYNLYLNSTEYNDLCKLLSYVFIPDLDLDLEDLRNRFIDCFINENTLRRLKCLTSQFCLEL